LIYAASKFPCNLFPSKSLGCGEKGISNRFTFKKATYVKTLMNRLKKMLTVGVMTMSVLSMTMVVGPVKAATVADGSLVRTNVKSATGGYAVYLIQNGKRYLFPSQNVYKSWYMNSLGNADFSKVQVISETDMYGYTFGGNVVYRPATKLVTFYEPNVYAVEPNGTIRSVGTAANAAALYGANWTNLIEDIDPSLRTNYTVGANLTLGQYPVGQVLSSGGTFYYWDGTNYRQFASEAALLANGFNKYNVVAATMAITAGGTTITGLETALFNVSQGATATTGGVTTGTGSGLTVALAADTPASATYVRSTGAVVAQSVAPFTKINFTASSDGDVVVSTVKLTRNGISADTDLSNVYLYDGSTKVAEYTSFNSKVVTFTNSAGLFTVPRGTTKTITVKADIAAANATVSGIVLGINAATDIVAGSAVVTGSFPINGNSMAVGTVADLGNLNIVAAANSNFPATINPGLTGQELWRFNVTANNQQMNIESLKVTIVGTVASTDLANFMLKDTAGNQIGATVAAVSSAKEVKFDASASPYIITSGQTKTLVVYGDVVNGSGRTFKFTIRKSADVVVKDNGYGVYTAPLNNGALFTLIDANAAGNGTSINNGTITSGVDASTPVGNVAAGATGVTLAAYDLKSNGEDVKVNYLRVIVTASASNDAKNGKLYWNGNQIGTTDTDVNVTNNGAATTSQAFTVNQIIPAGTTVVVKYIADTINYNTGAALAGTLHADLQANTAGDATGQSSLSDVAITSVTGKTLTLSGGTMTVAANAAFANMATASPTGVRGATNMKVGSFVITAGTGEGSVISQIALRDNTTAGGTTIEKFGKNFQNLKLMNAGVQIGTTQGSLASAGGDVYTFSLSPAITVAAGQQYVVDVYADSLSGGTGFITPGQHSGLEIDTVTGTGLVTSSATTATDPGVGVKPLQTLYLAASGNMTISLDSTNPVGQYLAMGTTANTIGAFRFDASTSAEDINVSKIILKDATTTYEAGYSNIAFYDGSTPLGTVASFSGGTATLNLVTNWLIPKGTARVLTIKADVNAFPNATSAGTMAVKINAAGDVTAIGAGSGTALAAGTTLSLGTSVPTANQMTFVKTKVTVAVAPGSPAGVSGKSSQQTVAIFRFSNTSNVAGQQAAVTDLALNVSTGGTWTGLSPTDSIRVYMNSVTNGNLLGTSPASTSPIGVALNNWVANGDTNPTPTSLKDFFIASGSYVDIYVTANTTGGTTTGDSMTVSIPSAAGIKWEDGVSTGAAALTTCDSLPVTAGTLTY
jgi:hypothetical protein